MGATGYAPKVLPSYCNDDPTKSTIVPLTSAQLSKVKSIKQVEVMIRHGARTPWGAEPCWVNYDVKWNDCNVTELMLASPTPYPYDSNKVAEPWLFRKIYDAFPSELNGENCYTGQLLSKGYDQELENGHILRKQYLENSNPSLNIFPSTNWTKIKEDQYFLRSDDEQRTLMSGQTVLSTLFDVYKQSIVPWHTGDEAIDQIAPNPTACPALNGVQELSYASPDFLKNNNSAEMNALTSQLDDILGAGYWTWYNVIDCFMTTVCTGREIPANPTTGAVLNDEIFNATIRSVEYQYAYNSNYNFSRFAKLGMGNTVYEMRTRLQAAVNNEAGAVKFALWSAHDTSVMPFLSAILVRPDGSNAWDGRWAQYASQVTIELYQAVSGGDLFRLTYNGKPLLVPGCTDTLCSVTVLLDAMDFAQEQMPCDALPVPAAAPTVPAPSAAGCAEEVMSSKGWTWLVVMMSLFSFSAGAGAVWWYNRRAAAKQLSDSAQNYSKLEDSYHAVKHDNTVKSPLNVVK